MKITKINKYKKHKYKSAYMFMRLSIKNENELRIIIDEYNWAPTNICRFVVLTTSATIFFSKSYILYKHNIDIKNFDPSDKKYDYINILYEKLVKNFYKNKKLKREKIQKEIELLENYDKIKLPEKFHQLCRKEKLKRMFK